MGRWFSEGSPLHLALEQGIDDAPAVESGLRRPAAGGAELLALRRILGQGSEGRLEGVEISVRMSRVPASFSRRSSPP